MAKRPARSLSGQLLGDRSEFTIHELCEACNVDADWVIELVTEGALEPAGTSLHDWLFSGESFVRVKKAYRLQRDLDLNLPGIALALDLLQEIDDLRARLRAQTDSPAKRNDEPG